MPAFSYRTLVSDVTNKTAGQTWTFTATDIGTADAARLVILGVQSGQAAIPSAVTIAGNAASLIQQDSTGRVSIWALVVASGSTADIVVTSVGSGGQCAVAVWAGYPASATKVDSGEASGTTTNPVVISDLEVVSGGFLVYMCVQAGSTGTFSTTWSGGDTVVEDADTLIETNVAHTVGHILTTSGSTTDDLTIAYTVSATKRGAAATWGASAGGSGGFGPLVSGGSLVGGGGLINHGRLIGRALV